MTYQRIIQDILYIPSFQQSDTLLFGNSQIFEIKSTGKSFSEALILAKTNPPYDKRLFNDLQVQYMKTTSSEHVVYINCFFVFLHSKQCMYTTNMF